MEELKVTDISYLKKLLIEGEIIELPPFFKGTQFCARVKRADLKTMVRAGKIRNVLLAEVSKIFGDDKEKKKNEKNKKSDEEVKKEAEAFDEFIEIIVSECLVSPSYEELKENGINLTDEQKLEIVNYSQTGVMKYKSFREEQ